MILGNSDVGMLKNEIQLLCNMQISIQKGVRVDVELEVLKSRQKYMEKVFWYWSRQGFFFNIAFEIGNNNNNGHMGLH